MGSLGLFGHSAPLVRECWILDVFTQFLKIEMITLPLSKYPTRSNVSILKIAAQKSNHGLRDLGELER